MNKFSTGQQVRVIFDKLLPGNSIGPDIKNGDIYPVKGSYTCKCGELHLNIGLESELNSITCYKCRESLPLSDVIHYCHSSRFEPVESPKPESRYDIMGTGHLGDY